MAPKYLLGKKIIQEGVRIPQDKAFSRTGMNDSDILTYSDSDSDSHIFCR